MGLGLGALGLGRPRVRLGLGLGAREALERNAPPDLDLGRVRLNPKKRGVHLARASPEPS